MKLYNAQEYQPECEKCFRNYQRRIQKALPLARIEHIGSSAIPNAISKGDLDIYVEVTQEQFESSILALKRLGFIEQTETLRTDELCMLISKHDNVALQVVKQGYAFEFFLIFRDQLIINPELVQRYNALKVACKELKPETYRQYKSAFIEQILQQYSA